MKSVRDIAQTLRTALPAQSLTQAELHTKAGISQRTLTNVLSGKEDFKVSTLLALADRLGLELVLLPKAAANAAEAGVVSAAPAVKSRVAAALDRLQERPR